MLLRFTSFLTFCGLPSINKTNFDKIPPKKGTQKFSYRYFINFSKKRNKILLENELSLITLDRLIQKDIASKANQAHILTIQHQNKEYHQQNN